MAYAESMKKASQIAALDAQRDRETSSENRGMKTPETYPASDENNTIDKVS